MHWMDRIGSVISATPWLYEPLFAGGWGDVSRLAALRAEARTVPPTDTIALEARVVSETPQVRITDIRFKSPSCHLPEAAQTAHARLIEPFNAARVAIGFASFNDHGYRTRAELAGPLLASSTAIALLENPYYGQRRPDPNQQPMRTVADLLAMGSAAVREGLAIAGYLADLAPWPIGFFGYSMGANIAALASATTPGPVACAALAASHSPGPVFTEGILESAVAWDALGGLSARAELAEVLGDASVLNFPAPPWSRAAIIVAAAGDGYIPSHAVEDLHRHWPGSELRIVRGGHASLLLREKTMLAGAIDESFSRLAAHLGSADS